MTPCSSKQCRWLSVSCSPAVRRIVSRPTSFSKRLNGQALPPPGHIYIYTRYHALKPVCMVSRDGQSNCSVCLVCVMAFACVRLFAMLRWWCHYQNSKLASVRSIVQSITVPVVGLRRRRKHHSTSPDVTNVSATESSPLTSSCDEMVQRQDLPRCAAQHNWLVAANGELY